MDAVKYATRAMALDQIEVMKSFGFEVQIEYLRTSSLPENIHTMCEDYRAGASIDLKHDEADLAKKIACPLMTLWGLKGPMGRPTSWPNCARS